MVCFVVIFEYYTVTLFTYSELLVFYCARQQAKTPTKAENDKEKSSNKRSTGI